MHVLWLWFGWPNGGVWSNLVAAVIGWATAWLWARTEVRALHQKLDGLHEKHDRLLAAVTSPEDGDG